MIINPTNRVVAAITTGLPARCLGFWISLRPGMITAEDKITIAANADVTLKNNSMISGKL